MVGAFTAVGGPGTLGWRSFAGVAAGIGSRWSWTSSR